MKIFLLLLLLACVAGQSARAATTRVPVEFGPQGDLIHNPECAGFLHDEFSHLLCDTLVD